MAQKVIEGDNDTCKHMHLILRLISLLEFTYQNFRTATGKFLAAR